jgi:hypothetical protein
MKKTDTNTESDPIVEQCRAEWDGDEKLRTEFLSFESYLGYRRGVAAGRVKLHGGKRAAEPEDEALASQNKPATISSGTASATGKSTAAATAQADSAKVPPIVLAAPSVPKWAAGPDDVEGARFKKWCASEWEKKPYLRTHYETFELYFSAVCAAQAVMNARAGRLWEKA